MITVEMFIGLPETVSPSLVLEPSLPIKAITDISDHKLSPVTCTLAGRQ